MKRITISDEVYAVLQQLSIEEKGKPNVQQTLENMILAHDRGRHTRKGSDKRFKCHRLACREEGEDF